MAEFLAVERPPVEALLAPFVYRRASTTLHGGSGALKTHFALSLAYALATGGGRSAADDWLPRVAGNVLYLDAELRAGLLATGCASLGRQPSGCTVLSRDDFLSATGSTSRSPTQPAARRSTPWSSGSTATSW